MTASKSGPCVAVGKGSVGESGAFTLIEHQVTGRIPILMVLRNTDTSLCPDHGAFAVLLVNGNLEASGNVTAQGSSIQAEANPGDRVTAVVFIVPLHNGVVCVRLGDVYVQLDQCDLV
jgi:hypothetical protein